MGNTLIIILIVVAMAATVFALVRGIVIFLRTTEADLKGEGLNNSGVRQNRAMMQRVMFQAVAVILVVLLAVMAGRS